MGDNEPLGIVVGCKTGGFGVKSGYASSGGYASADTWREAGDGSAGACTAVAGNQSVTGACEGCGCDGAVGGSGAHKDGG